VHRNKNERTIAMTDFNKLFQSFQGLQGLQGFQGLNAEAFATAQKRNLETFVQAGQIMASGTQSMVAKQVAALQALTQDGVAAMQAVWGAKDPQVGLKTQFDYATGAQQKAMALAAEIAEIAQKTGQEAFEILRKRAEEGTAEVVAFQGKKAA
jgi:phasin family protein